MNYAEATADMAATFFTRWKAGATPIAGTVPYIAFPGVAKPELESADKIWGRFSFETIIEEQRALTANPNLRRHTAAGLVYVQLFSPIGMADGYEKIKNLATLAKSAFTRRSNSGNIWFRRPTIRPLPAESVYNRLTVVAEFEYDEFV